MLTKLQEALFFQLPELLGKRDAWDSLIVNRRKPFTYRVFSQLPDGLRVCLHKFDPCHTDEAFLHPHPWPGAFIILAGSYEMMVGRSPTRDTKPDDVLKIVLPKYSMYEIVQPLTWHSVTPLTTTYTIMVNDTPWPADVVHTDVRRTAGKDLDKMPENELKDHLATFQLLLQDYIKYYYEMSEIVRGERKLF